MSQIEAVKAEHRTSRSRVDDLQIVRDRSLYERRFKRPIDVVGALIVLIIASPIIVGIALLIRWRLGKGVLYTQQRVGAGQEPFTIYKFRTMRPDRRQRQIDLTDTQDRRSMHKRLDDPRHTRLGRLLRRLSLDELPQLLNVLRGDMSLVGPRPEIFEVARDRGYLDHPRHEVKPGMTGPYQVSDLRLNGDLLDGLEVDAEYVNTLTAKNDLRYVAKTVGVLLGGASGS